MKLLKKIYRLKLSDVIWLVIFALVVLSAVQGYLLLIQVNVQQTSFKNKLSDILLEIHHAVEDDSISSATLISYLQKIEQGEAIPNELKQSAKGILYHKVDSVGQEFGVELQFNFVIFNPNTGEILLASKDRVDNEGSYFKQSVKAGWRIREALGEGKYRIGINFKNAFLFWLEQIKFLLLISILLIFLLIFSFYAAINGWRKQKQLSELKNEFINNLTHELKTPIFSVSLLHNVINKMNGESSPKLKKYLQLLQNENQKLKDRVEKVMDITMIENTNLPLDFQVHDLHPLIKEACEMLEFFLHQQNGKIIYNFDANNSFGYVDKVHFTGVIYNLVDNAIKYSLEPATIEIFTFNQNDQFCIKVKDQGIGISKKEYAKIFDKFYRIPTGNLHKVKGFGLGLSYVKMMVEAQKGHITIDSEKNKGSEFTIVLPNVENNEVHDTIDRR